MAGFAAARGDLSILGILAAGTLGSIGGALFWYVIGRRIGTERLRRWVAAHGRWLTVSPKDLDQAVAWFSRRHAGKAVFASRLIPAVRTLISVPAGVAGMPLPLFWPTPAWARHYRPCCSPQPTNLLHSSTDGTTCT